MTHIKEIAHMIDCRVGNRLRVLRVRKGMTQEDVAKKLLMSYQQVQKYETGANRISAGILYVIADMLDVEVSYFFEGHPPTGVAELKHGGTNRATLEVAKNFGSIQNPMVKTAAASLLKSLAS
ncbi:MAG: helix-turn-helix transcriptional regulator [Sneathiella sp.]